MVLNTNRRPTTTDLPQRRLLEEPAQSPSLSLSHSPSDPAWSESSDSGSLPSPSLLVAESAPEPSLSAAPCSSASDSLLLSSRSSITSTSSASYSHLGTSFSLPPRCSPPCCCCCCAAAASCCCSAAVPLRSTSAAALPAPDGCRRCPSCFFCCLFRIPHDPSPRLGTTAGTVLDEPPVSTNPLYRRIRLQRVAWQTHRANDKLLHVHVY
jgi:hypothetical protein